MGNSQSGKNSSTSSKKDKGPYSDNEFNSLNEFYNSLISEKNNLKSGTQQLKIKLKEYIGEEKLQWIDQSLLNHFTERLYLTLMQDEKTLKFNQFMNIVSQCTRSSSETIVTCFFNIFDEEKTGYLKRQQLVHLWKICYFFSLCLLESLPKNIDNVASVPMDPLINSIINDSDGIQLDKFCAWITVTTPLLYCIISDFISGLCLNVKAKSFSWPRLSCPSDSMNGVLCFAMSLSSIDLQQSWERLFASTNDGLSFNRLCHHVLGYHGPTITIVSTAGGGTFAMYADAEWQESNVFYGGGDCRLFRLSPVFNVYRTKATGSKNFMYLNTKGFSLPHGIGMGGNINDFRVFLDEDFENCVSKVSCLTFESGNLTGRKSFQVELIEVWGCGGDEAKHAQAVYRDETAKLIDRARKVDKAKFAESGFDQEFFLSKTFGHHAVVRGKADDEH